MRNNFTQKTRSLFWDNYSCWSCGYNKFDILHHIVGRGNKHSELESSPFNAAPLCNFSCHIGKPINKEYTTKKFLQLTEEYLKRINYKPTDKDKAFLEKYKQYYVSS